MIFGVWNVRIFFDFSIINFDRSERRIVFVIKELARFNIDIVVLSEIRLLGEGKTEEVGFGYIIFWKGREEGERRF